MGLKNAIPGKRPPAPKEEPLPRSDRLPYSPMFTAEHGEQPNAVGGYSLEDTTDRRTFALKGTAPGLSATETA
jgi:hypothetical protein